MVYYRYYRFNPDKGVSDYVWYYKNNEIQSYSPGPPEATNRKTNVFIYDELGRIIQIDFYREDSDDQVRKGGKYKQSIFKYNSSGQLIQNKDSLYNIEDHVYTVDFHYNNNLPAYLVYTSKNYDYSNIINMSFIDNKIIFYQDDANYYWSNEYEFDSFKNIIGFKEESTSPFHKNDEYFYYPKNIYNPFYNVYTPQSKPLLIYNYYYKTDFSTHFSSGRSNSYYESIQLNEFGFPEIIQSGSYDEGYRTKYYYSIIN